MPCGKNRPGMSDASNPREDLSLALTCTTPRTRQYGALKRRAFANPIFKFMQPPILTTVSSDIKIHEQGEATYLDLVTWCIETGAAKT